MLGLGHRAVSDLRGRGGSPGWLAGEPGPAGGGGARADRQGGRRVPVPRVEVGEWSARAGCRAGLWSPHRVTSPRASAPGSTWRSACCASCTRLELDAWRDINVVGFDGIPGVAYVAPLPAGSWQDLGELGRRALGLLVEELEGGAHTRSHVRISAGMVLRCSAGLLPAVDPAASDPAVGRGSDGTLRRAGRARSRAQRFLDTLFVGANIRFRRERPLQHRRK